MDITYLIGAGASQQSLPVVAQMSSEIYETIKWFRSVTHGTFITKQNIINSIVSDLTSLAEICEPQRNFSIDTYAKKLRISGRESEYVKLKDTLTLFFTLQQRRKLPDVRYDNFWASLLNQKDAFPDNIKILSWNYDFQLELSYQDFIQSNSLRESATALNLVTPKTVENKYKNPSKFSIFKLNGSATYNSEIIKNEENYVINNIKDCSINEAIEKIIDYYSIRNVEIENHLSYAWEHELSNNFLSHLIR